MNKSGIFVSIRSRPYDTSLHDKRVGWMRVDSNESCKPDMESKPLICGSRAVFISYVCTTPYTKSKHISDVCQFIAVENTPGNSYNKKVMEDSIRQSAR